MRIILSAILLVCFTYAAHAGSKKHSYKHPDAYRYVRAESQYNINKYIIAPVRHARLGDQVLVPKQGWTYCEVTCEYTLQKEYLDFWEDQNDGGIDPGHVFDYIIGRHY